jgi:hypothetical protein
MTSANDERRVHPRASAELRVQLSGTGARGADSITVSTLNVSTGGVYVQVPRFIEPLTKLFLTMLVPGPTPSEEPIFVDTEAIVVRTIPEQSSPEKDRSEIACAFLDLDDDHRDVINRYVLTHRVKAPA